MKKFLLLTMTGLIATSLLGCDDSKPAAGTQPVAGNEPPKYGGGAAKAGPLGRMQGKTAPTTNLNDKKSVEP